MKKIAILAGILFLSSISFAQLGFGIKGAFTMSNLTTDFEEIEKAARTGYQIGAFLRIGDKWHLQPEAYFTAKTGQFKYTGVDVSDPMNTGEVKQDVTLSTIDIPVLIGYKVIDPPTMNLRIHAGPVASLVMNKKFEVSGDGIDPAEPSDEYKDGWKDMNWGLQMGAGIDFLFLTADIRYELGLSNLWDKPENSMEDIGTLKNHIFFISVGWKIL